LKYDPKSYQPTIISSGGLTHIITSSEEMEYAIGGAWGGKDDPNFEFKVAPYRHTSSWYGSFGQGSAGDVFPHNIEPKWYAPVITQLRDWFWNFSSVMTWNLIKTRWVFSLGKIVFTSDNYSHGDDIEYHIKPVFIGYSLTFQFESYTIWNNEKTCGWAYLSFPNRLLTEAEPPQKLNTEALLPSCGSPRPETEIWTMTKRERAMKDRMWLKTKRFATTSSLQDKLATSGFTDVEQEWLCYIQNKVLMVMRDQSPTSGNRQFHSGNQPAAVWWWSDWH